MPASAAHYQFGQDVITRLDPKLRGVILAHKKEFDVGLQGPDIFFFHQPYRKNNIAAYGTRRHDEPGQCMFESLLERTWEGASLAYLMGLTCHYVLDKTCHPYVVAHSPTAAEHRRMESAFDRHVMMKNQSKKSRYHDIPAGTLDYEAMTRLWPGMTVQTVRDCVKAERCYTRLLDHRKFLDLFEKAAKRPGEFTSMSLPKNVTEEQVPHVRFLDTLYKKALQECPERIENAVSLMGTKTLNGLGFEQNYLGQAVPQAGGRSCMTE